jgi:hypothetical protein
MEWNEQKRFLASQLSGDEVLLWSGEPRHGVFFRPSDLYTVPASLLGACFIGLWLFLVTRSSGEFSSFFLLFGSLGILQAAYWLIGRFFVDAWQRSKTYYGVTNERVIIIAGLFSRHIKSLPMKTITELSVNERSDLSGTITFGPEDASNWASRLGFSGNKREPVYPILDTIPNVKRVYGIIMNAQRDSWTKK